MIDTQIIKTQKMTFFARDSVQMTLPLMGWQTAMYLKGGGGEMVKGQLSSFVEKAGSPFNGEGDRQPDGGVARCVGDHMREGNHVPVGVVGDVVGIRVVFQREDEGEDEVEHVEDGQRRQVPVGAAAHPPSGHDHHSDGVAHNAHHHDEGHKDSLHPKTDCITVVGLE